MRSLLFIITVSLAFSACKDYTDVDPQQTDAFIHYFGDLGNTQGNDIKELSNGDLLLLGTNEQDGILRTVLIKTDAYGNIIGGWPKSYIGFRGQSLQADDGGYYIIGDRINTQTDSVSMMLLVTNTSGDSTSSITVNSDNIAATSENFNYYGTALDVSGTATALGYTKAGTSTNLIRVGFDLASSTISWTQFLPAGGTYLPGVSLLPTADGHQWVTTYTANNTTKILVQSGKEGQPSGNSGEVSGSHGRQLTSTAGGFAGIGTRNNSMVVFLTDMSGNILAESEVDAPAQTGQSIHFGSSGLVALGTGVSAEEGQLDNDFILVKLPSAWVGSPQPQFVTRIGGSGDEESGVVIESAAGGYIILGTSNFDGGQSMVLIKTNKDGNLKL